MADDEDNEVEVEEEDQPATEEEKPQDAPPASKPEHKAQAVKEPQSSEAKVRMEMELKKRSERAAEEWREYEEMRKADRERAEEEIRELRERREKRKKDRAEEEQRLAELRQIEEQKKKAEEDERQRKKREEEQNKRDERDRKRREAEERATNIGKRNFVITKSVSGSAEEAEEKKESLQVKSKEQLEAEKEAILSQRLQPLNIDGMDGSALKNKAQELFNMIIRLEGDKYDLETQFKTEQYNMMELAERARQMNKGGKKEKVQVQTESDPLTEKLTAIPPKITMYSPYERVKDHRSYSDRKTLFTGPLYAELYEKINPTKKIVIGDQGAVVDGELETSEPTKVEEEPDATAEVEVTEE